MPCLAYVTEWDADAGTAGEKETCCCMAQHAVLQSLTLSTLVETGTDEYADRAKLYVL